MAVSPKPKHGSVRPPAWHVAENLWQSFAFAGAGVAYAVRTQRNFRIHLAVMVVALGLGVWLRVSRLDLAVVGLTCGLVLALELINTAIEAIVDLQAGERYFLLAKIAKDCAAGAVLVAASVAMFVAGLVLLPPLWVWIS